MASNAQLETSIGSLLQQVSLPFAAARARRM
jgi:hypothetical protein